MATFKNPNGKWYARVSTGVRTPSGNYKYVTSKHGFATQQEAKLDEAELRLHVAGNKYSGISKIKNHELIDRYIATKNIRRTTARTYQSYARHIKRFLPDIPARDTTPLHIAALRQDILDGHLSLSAARSMLTLIKTIYTWAANMDMILKSPAKNLQVPPRDSAKGLHIDMVLLKKILRIAKTNRYEQLYIPLLLAGMCGLRISEICGLQEADVTDAAIHVRHNYIRGQGGASLQALKTKAAFRTIPLIPFVAGEIKEYREFLKLAKKEALQRRQEMKDNPAFLEQVATPAWNQDGFFFVFAKDGRPHESNYVERNWAGLKRSSQMSPLIQQHPELAGMRLHDFRHSFGSNLRYAGAPIEDVTELLGHSDSNFTRTTYAIPLKGTHERSMSRLSVLVSGEKIIIGS